MKALATLSNGSTFDGPKALRSNLARLKRLSRSLSRKVGLRPCPRYAARITTAT
ncbi:MAG: hypothetical protein K2Q10_14840 [Rhodospirillales bacterium]|nr:hypothetical protein [Rhodospirillales bacterium]